MLFVVCLFSSFFVGWLVGRLDGWMIVVAVAVVVAAVSGV